MAIDIEIGFVFRKGVVISVFFLLAVCVDACGKACNYWKDA